MKSTGQGYGANIMLPVVPKMLDFQAGILAGKGVGRYGSRSRRTHGNANTLGADPAAWSPGIARLTFRPVSTLTTFVYAGKEMVDKQYYNFNTAKLASYGYGYGDPLAVNSGCETEGVGTCAANTSQIISGTVGGWWKFYRAAGQRPGRYHRYLHQARDLQRHRWRSEHQHQHHDGVVPLLSVPEVRVASPRVSVPRGPGP